MTCYYTQSDCERMAEKQIADEEAKGEKPKETARERADRIWKIVESSARGS